MGDSPLSIAASIAGLLTFAVAILASIYVRYVSLRNGRVELEGILESSKENVVDLGLTKTENPDPILRERWEHLAIHESDKPDVVRLKTLNVLLIATDMIIYTYCVRTLNDDMEEFLRNRLDSFVKARNGNTRATMKDLLELQDKIRRMLWRRSPMERALGLYAFFLPNNWVERPQKILKRILQRILSAGSHPNSVRWYRVRETVLGMVQQRDILRSRILSLQVSMINSSAGRSDIALERLEKQQAELKIRLEELTRLVTTACHAPARPASDDTSGIPEETHTQVSPGQQEDVKRHVGAEGSELETTDCCA